MIVKSHSEKEGTQARQQTGSSTAGSLRRAEDVMNETPNEKMRQNSAEKNDRHAEALSQMHPGFAPSEEENPKG